ncbi:MutS family DNA mismatch repair protein [Candidatus Chloroploca asiatica]|uniref:DNA mismatch repair proteins mutS family domain-containing protein n=1 Tax=Candidatus Chloroploca asiatica TaxID=1506545 RepID=A0A2H3KT93_9CHLR|nr:MutS family DNA mismatch repair protein [Candidatus Chloroploca asiatica]PDV97082.1 hypothetical protein A9Q02_19375 [Candidatus Chloroploca asiatica]
MPVTRVEQIYQERRTQFEALRVVAARRWSQVANWRLIIAVALMTSGGVGWWRGLPILLWLALGLLGLFLGLVAYHNRLAAQRDRLAALVAQNDEGLVRLRRDWAALPLRQPTGHILEATELMLAVDLDLLGPASLQHLLNTPRSPAGRATLQRWLLSPARPHVVYERQQAVAELAPLIDLRDELAFLAEEAGEVQERYERFTTWAQGAPWLVTKPGLLWVMRVSPLLLVISIIVQMLGLTVWPLWGPFLLLNLSLTALYGWRSIETLSQLYDRGELLATYAGLFGHLASPSWQAPTLQRLKATLGQGAERADHRLQRLSLIAAGAELSRSLLFPVLQFGLLWNFHIVALAERWRQRSGGQVEIWLTTLGEMEALAALATLQHDHPTWQMPVVQPSEPPRIQAEQLAHPLLMPDQAVANSITIGPPGSFVLITGSNMSGKSTLLRAVGINVVLAQAGGPVCAEALRLPPVALATSMRVQDSLARGVSYFMAELQRLKQIVDLARTRPDEHLVCFLLDEILHGTNSTERLIAAAQVISHLVELEAIGIVSTHDLALATDPQLQQVVQLAHFSEYFTNDAPNPEMRFDYQLRPGLATTTNALRLMALVGLPCAST